VTYRHPEVARDAEALAVLGRKTFIETFIQDYKIPYPHLDVQVFLDSRFTFDNLAASLRETGAMWWVAEKDGELIGFANAGPCELPHDDVRPSHLELRRLYVSKASQGLGVGKHLMKLAMDWMLANTTEPIWLGVWSGNERALGFYRSYGFQKVGEYKFPVGSWTDDEFIMQRPPSAPSQ
jgi:ribosomal protein S18 acetylase RimI-like enzyme